jgi:lipooligosaccharide transport system ATP-binding protein
MRLLTAQAIADEGELELLGFRLPEESKQARAELGVSPQLDNLDVTLTVEQNLLVFAHLYRIGRAERRHAIERALVMAKLKDRRDSRVDKLSGGMRRRLLIARALIHRPRLVLMDEPTVGLDPQARHAVWEQLFRLKEQGVTTVLTTHYMDEAEQLCDRLVVMDGGRIVAEGSPADLILRHATREVVELRFAAAIDVQDVAARVDGLASRIEPLPDRVLLYTEDGDGTAAAVHSRGLQTTSTLVRRSTLEDVFLRLTGRTLVD